MVRVGIDAGGEGDGVIEERTRHRIVRSMMSFEERVLEALDLVEHGTHEIGARPEVDEHRRDGDTRLDGDLGVRRTPEAAPGDDADRAGEELGAPVLGRQARRARSWCGHRRSIASTPPRCR